MGKIIENKDRVDTNTLRTYEQVDVRHTIKEWLKMRGVDVCIKEQHHRKVKIDDLVYMALIDNGLKFNTTNKMYVGYYICVGAHRCGLWHDDKYCEVPEEIYNEAKEENEQFAKGGKA
ncbi:MAG: hypothetical protein IJ064_05705 [Bacteroidaceae bacterium]|nr:hypothetical protein [Bacteroidaceae bacterium]